MRKTSIRRSTVTRRAAYHGAPSMKRDDAGKVDVTVEDGIECGSCHAIVPPLQADPDRPSAHAPGGYRTNTRKGRYKCPGSGNDGLGKRYAS